MRLSVTARLRRSRPSGLQATPHAYRDWLISELTALPVATDDSIDLVGHDWGGALASQDNGSGTQAMRSRAAARAGARAQVLPELGHWWMLQDPQGAATLLHRFSTTLPAPAHSQYQYQ